MLQVIKKFLDNGIDADSAEHLVPPNSFISGQDVRIGQTTDLGGVGYIENILENAEKSHVLPSGGVNTTIGFAVDDEQGWVVKFNHNSIGDHGIYLYVIYLETWYDLLLEADVTGGLNFEKNELIHSTRIENGMLYWCNGTLNQPRRINIRAAVNLYQPNVYTDVEAYTSPLSQNVIYWIRRQPGLPPTVEKQTASPDLNNFIKDEGFWFYYRYIYRDYEISTLSGLSTLANYNASVDTYNFLYVELPVLEEIEQDVLQVDLVVKYANSGKSFVIKSWNRDVAADEAEIVAHNNGTPLNFDYHNDFIGIALDDAYSVKPYDSLPIYAQTIEIARNRAHMANYTLGYDSPTVTSLEAEFQTSEQGATNESVWYRFGFGTMGSPDNRYMILVTTAGVAYNGYYLYAPYSTLSQPYPLPLPDTVAYGTITFIGSEASEAEMELRTNWGATGTLVFSEVVSFETITITAAPFTTSLQGQRCFKSDSPYKINIVFRDFAGRKCGIVPTNIIYTTPDRDFDSVAFTTSLNWELSNTNAVNEIPIWADYYDILISKCIRTRFFLSSRVKNITYATKDADGEYVFNTSAYAATANGIAIDFTLLNSYGMGYTWVDGDLIKVYKDADATVYTLSIVAQQGNWLICELEDLGAIGNTASPFTDALFEVYTPYRPSSDEPLYEVGESYLVSNAGTASRAYSVLEGRINGDVTLISRNDGSVDYLTENMSPNDKFYTRWNTDSGRPNFLDTIGQVTKTNDIAYSDVLIQGTKTNGLSTFEALNTKEVPVECGDIIKLQVADKITEQGNIMLAICVNETASLYLSEAQLLGSTGNAFIAQAADVIGTVNVLQGSYGSMNPESVVAARGRVFFYCLIKGCFVSYSNNGLFPVSDYGLRRVAHLFSQAYAALTQAEIESLGSRPFVFGGVDPYHLEVYWSIPATTATPPKGYLQDYVSPDLPVIYPYDIYDGRAKVLVFKPGVDKWAAPHNYETEYFIAARDYLYSAKNGAMYQHNNDNGTDDTYSKWYGESVNPSIGFIINEEPNIVKQFLTLSVEGNAQPSWCHQRTELPFVQSSDLVDEWVDREGVLYSQINRDRLSPNVPGTYDEKLYTGDKMRGQWLKVYAEFTTNELLQIRFFNCGVVPSGGHKT